MDFVLAISGPIAAGKSSVLSELVRLGGAARVSTRSILQTLRAVPNERGGLQAAGEELDRETGGRWVADALAARMHEFTGTCVIVIDSVRIRGQVEHLRELFGEQVRHIHLTAHTTVLEVRFAARKAAGDPAVTEFATYAEAQAHSIEASVEELAEAADYTIDTSDLIPTAVAEKVLVYLGGKPRR